MNEDQLERLAQNKNFIPGIYNYCDRWCERCPLSARCMNFAIEREDKAAAEAARGGKDAGADRDQDNEAFWQRLSENFACTRRMIEKHCEEEGIDLSPESLAEVEREEKKRRKKVRTSPLAKSAERYYTIVEKWFTAHPELIEEKQAELQSAADMALPGRDPQREADQIVEAIEVIRWYEFFIAAKVVRAVSGLVDIEEDGPEYHESDANGSAKIALIAIDRSIAAWAQLREHQSDAHDSILDLLVHLDRLRRAVEQAFPKARSFKRPGFDDPKIVGKKRAARAKR